MRYFDGLQHFTPAEAARALGLTLHQVYGLIRGRTLDARMWNGNPYIPKSELERYASVLDADGEQQVARRLLRAMGVRQRLLFSWRN